jgi:hypothetical protein
MLRIIVTFILKYLVIWGYEMKFNKFFPILGRKYCFLGRVGRKRAGAGYTLCSQEIIISTTDTINAIITNK